jgi:uncharacterized protein
MGSTVPRLIARRTLHSSGPLARSHSLAAAAPHALGSGNSRAMLRVGLISDTHSLLRPEAKAFLQGSDYIVHAGDICDARILEELAAIAPVTAVRGNNDKGSWAKHLRETEFLQVGEMFIYVIHDLAKLDIEPGGAGVRVVVFGHSHRPLIEERGGVLYVNPGSSGSRRFTLPVSAGELIINGDLVSGRTVELVGKNEKGVLAKAGRR